MKKWDGQTVYTTFSRNQPALGNGADCIVRMALHPMDVAPNDDEEKGARWEFRASHSVDDDGGVWRYSCLSKQAEIGMGFCLCGAWCGTTVKGHDGVVRGIEHPNIGSSDAALAWLVDGES